MSEKLLEYGLRFILPGDVHKTDVRKALRQREIGWNEIVEVNRHRVSIGFMMGVSGRDRLPVDTVISTAGKVISVLPAGARLHTVEPDLVSHTDVAEALRMSRRELHERGMPAPVYSDDVYHLGDVYSELTQDEDFRIPDEVMPWFRGGAVAREVNGLLAAGLLDRETLEADRRWA